MVRINTYNIGVPEHLSAEKKLKLLEQVLGAKDIDIKKFSYFQNEE